MSLADAEASKVAVDLQEEDRLETSSVKRQPSDLLGEGRRISPFRRWLHDLLRPQIPEINKTVITGPAPK